MACDVYFSIGHGGENDVKRHIERDCHGTKASALARRLVNKCMSTHLNANKKISFDSNEYANAIFHKRIQMQMEMCWDRIQLQM